MKWNPAKYVFIFALVFQLEAKEIFMSTEGNDETGDGTIDNPYLTIMKCQKVAESGDTVYIRGGTYSHFTIANSTKSYNYIFYFTKSFITYKAYESEKVIFDFEFNKDYAAKDGIKKQRVTGFMIENGVQNITFENFDCTRIPALSSEDVEAAGLGSLTQSECFQSRGKNIRFNRINSYNNYGIGFYFVGTNSYNIAYRCDSYNNSGPDTATKGNADGFGAHGTGAELIECRAWDNSDDNYDSINSFKSVTFDKCWAFRINYKAADVQDGNGLKVGGWGKKADAKERYKKYSGDNPPVHIVKNCIAAYNKAYGFYSNHQPGQAAVWYNNRAYNNKANFDMTEGSETWELDSSGNVKDICGTREVLFFNIAHKYKSGLSDKTCNMYGTEGNLFTANVADVNNSFNSWNFRNITLSDKDFLSVDYKQLAKPRGEDGSLPEITFMQLNPNGPNYNLLKTIEEEIKNYELLSNGTIIKINQDSSDNDVYKSCITVIPNCENCISEDKCVSCNNGFYLVKEDNGAISCKNIDNINQYYKIIEDEVEYYKKCNIENCNECNDINYCTKCNQNFAIIEDDHTKCEDLSTEKYYLDYTDSKYKLCNNGLTNCVKCSNYGENNNIFKCKECETDYALKHSSHNNIECALKNTLEGDRNFYTDDEGKNYYSCSSYNDALYCSQCAQKEICSECQLGYTLDNNGKTCYSQNEIDSNLVVFDSKSNSYVFCKDVMKGCNKCKNTTTCDICQFNFAIVDYNECLPESSLLNNNRYILLQKIEEAAETVNKYIRCSTAMENCDTCSSSSECTSCASGYYFNNGNLCEKITEKDDDGSLSTGGIVGIVIGSIGFLLITGLVAYYFLKKMKKPALKQNEIGNTEYQNQNVNEINEESIIDSEKGNEIIGEGKQSKVVIHKINRKIQN